MHPDKIGNAFCIEDGDRAFVITKKSVFIAFMPNSVIEASLSIVFRRGRTSIHPITTTTREEQKLYKPSEKKNDTRFVGWIKKQQGKQNLE